MPARTRDLLCILACAMIGAIVWTVHMTSWPHSTQRPLKVAVIVLGLMAVGAWRALQIRRFERSDPARRLKLSDRAR